MIRRPPRSTQSRSSAASDVYKRQVSTQSTWAILGADNVNRTLRNFPRLGSKLKTLIDMLIAGQDIDNIAQAYSQSGAIIPVNQLRSFAFDVESLKNQLVQEVTSKIPELAASQTQASITIDNWKLYEGDVGIATKTIMDSLISVRSLVELKLDFNQSNIKDDGCKAVSQVLQHFSTTLTNVDLNLKFCYNITDAGLRDLGNTIAKCSSLVHLQLNFAFLDKITDIGVGDIASALSFLSNLTRLHLFFDECPELTDRSVEGIIGALRAPSTLTEVTLHLWK
eukprot:TRINITY_DN3867_c0_g1_i13.p1 TRINITY_DN3867_c0_g1~~TRINITY_DN3867_c0_g1_i13.p1  ORF type:complete len:281 (+),score=46.94 TRINITY_DN3867_c0_g1_i13:24-866(+)